MDIVAFKSALPNVLEDSTGRSVRCKGIGDTLEFLTSPIGDDSCLRVVGKVDEFAAPIFRMLHKKEAKELHATSTLMIPLPCETGGNILYKIKYVSTPAIKLLIFERKGTEHPIAYYHMAQFSPNGDNLGDLESVVALGQSVLATAKKMGFSPKVLYTTGSIVGPTLEHMDLPKYTEIPADAALYAMRCTDTDWREAHTLGYFPNSYRYDLSSAFPNVHKNLLDYRMGTWLRKEEYDPSACYGFCHCQITIFPSVTVTPIIVRVDNEEDEDASNLFAPTGTWDGYLTSDEIKFILHFKLGEVKVKDAWYFYPAKFCHKPMLDFIQRLQVHKSSPDPMTRHLAKQLLVCTWGKTRQVQDYKKTPTVGTLFNPPWSAIIKSRPRLTVAKCLYRHNVNPLNIVTDGFATLEPILLSSEETAIGWRQDYHGESLIASTGLNYYSTKHPLSFTIEEIKRLVRDEPNACYWEKHVQKMCTLGDAIRFNSLDALGTIQIYSTSLDLTGLQHNRLFPRVPENGKELLSEHFYSTPIKYNPSSCP